MNRKNLIVMRDVFDEELNEKFSKAPDGKIQANFGVRVCFVKMENNRPVDEYKHRFPTEYQMQFDNWFDTIHPY